MSTLILPEAANEPEDVADVTKPACPSCKFYRNHFPLEQKQDGSCHANPPQVAVYGVGQHRITGQQMPLTMSFWPAVNPKDWCGQYERKLDA